MEQFLLDLGGFGIIVVKVGGICGDCLSVTEK